MQVSGGIPPLHNLTALLRKIRFAAGLPAQARLMLWLDSNHSEAYRCFEQGGKTAFCGWCTGPAFLHRLMILWLDYDLSIKK